MKTYLSLLFIILFLYSCNNDDTSVNSNSDENTEENGEENGGGNEDNDEPLITAIEPCTLSDFNIEESSTVIIDCLLDLEGQNIDIPSGVTFQFDGGDIFNGTLNFGTNGQIDGELLNSELIISGDIQLTSNEFQFHPDRWKIVEGKVDDETARNNRDFLENLFLEIKDLGANTFVIDDLDAYFKVDGYLNEAIPTNQGINIPSDYNLVMSDNTHLRMQPNGHFRNCLVGIYNESNITITGGFLHGEREEHDYNSGFVDSDGSTGASNGWLHCMRIKGGQDIIIDGVTFMDPAGDGINISGINHFFQPDHVKSTNITIKNCEFYRARRTNVVITSGDEITIENNRIEDGGIDMENSTGTAPSSNFNIEAVRSYDSDGNLIEYQRVNNVYLRNNIQVVNDKEANPNAGSFQISHANGPIIIEGNEMINTGVGFFTADGVEIKNNTITNGSITAGSAENFGRESVVYDNIVSGNVVVTDGTAINISGNGVIVRDNEFEGVIGVSFGPGATDESKGASNIEFTNNTIVGSNRGIMTNNTMHNVTIDNNEIQLTEDATFAAVLVNRWSEDFTDEANFIFSNNTITGEKEGSERGAPPTQFWGNSCTIQDNYMGELQFGSGNNVNVIGNKIEAPIHKSAILINNQITNTSFTSNEITIYPSITNIAVECVKIAEDIDLSTITFTDQECIEK